MQRSTINFCNDLSFTEALLVGEEIENWLEDNNPALGRREIKIRQLVNPATFEMVYNGYVNNTSRFEHAMLQFKWGKK